MTGVVSTSSVGPALEHIALFYEHPSEAADRLAAAIEDDHRIDRAVLVCLPDALRDLLIDRTNPDRLTVMDDTVRYHRPIDAMAALWAFVQRSHQSGVESVHSIGQIQYDGSDADEQWHWYEAAVNDVFGDHHLKATCLFDLCSTPAGVIPAACTTHLSVDGLDGLGGARTAPPEAPPARPAMVLPARRADLHLAEMSTSGPARAALRRAAGHLPTNVMQRAELVLSECITNAVVHGAGQADVEVWVDADGLTFSVSDDGPGCTDPFASLRPPELPVRGAGLWVCHLESSQFALGPRIPHGTTVTARID